MFKFLWNKTEKVKRIALMQDYDTGGVKMFDVDLFRKKMICKQIQKIVTDKTNSCAAFVAKAILNRPVPNLLLLKFNTTSEDIATNIPSVKALPIYYQTMVVSWYQCKKIDRELQSHDVIWLNDSIKYKSKTLFFDKWIKRDIVYVEDVTTGESLLPHEDLAALSGNHPDFMLKFHLLKSVFRKLKWTDC
jgi:hypothetical protein